MASQHGNNAPRVAWIGLGNMGRGMVKNIVEKGTYAEPLLIHNRTTARSEKLASALPSGKVKVVTSVEEAVKGADYIFSCVANDAAVQETFDVALKLPEAKGKLFIECSTIHPDLTNKLAKAVEDAGASFVACPVFGAPAMADAGQLICVLAGSKANVAKVKPFCKGVMGRGEIDFADKPFGDATRLKIIGNTLILNMVEALSEAHVLAEKSGVDNKVLHDFVDTLFGAPYSPYSGRLMSGDYYTREEPAFQAKLAIKDASHAQALARECGVKLPALEVAKKNLEQVVEHAGDKGDISGIYGAVRQNAGLKFENQ